MTPFNDPEIAAVFENYPTDMGARLLDLRQLIFETAELTPHVGKLQEALKWGQPSYLTVQSKSGSTIRIDRFKRTSDRIALFFHCQSRLIPTIREIYGDQFAYEGNRAMVFDINQALPAEPLRHAIALALTYHLRKKSLNQSRKLSEAE